MMRITFWGASHFEGAAFCKLGLTLFVALSSCNGASDRQTDTSVEQRGRSAPAAEVGIASHYGAAYHGKRTASGEFFDMHQLTAAHPRYSFGTRVRVTHVGNQRSVIVRINDRGPFIKGRIIDLSRAAAEELQMLQSGLAEVKVEIVEWSKQIRLPGPVPAK